MKKKKTNSTHVVFSKLPEFIGDIGVYEHHKSQVRIEPSVSNTVRISDGYGEGFFLKKEYIQGVAMTLLEYDFRVNNPDVAGEITIKMEVL